MNAASRAVGSPRRARPATAGRPPGPAMEPVPGWGQADGEEPLRQAVERCLRAYFERLGDQPACELYELVLGEMEAPLLAVVMERCANNQVKAAALLGLNRATLRRKLRRHGLIEEPAARR